MRQNICHLASSNDFVALLERHFISLISTHSILSLMAVKKQIDYFEVYLPKSGPLILLVTLIHGILGDLTTLKTLCNINMYTTLTMIIIF